MAEILVLYYSRHGHVAQLANLVARGVEEVDGMQARIRTVPRVATAVQSPEDAIPSSGPPYATLEDLRQCVGVAVGSPTHFGNMAASMKYFWDNTSTLWLGGALAGKPASVFTASSSMHGGQETTLVSMMLPLMHHGMLIVGLPYTDEDLMNTTGGGTPYGATHVSGSDSRGPVTEAEQRLSRALGRRLAQIAKKLAV